MAQYFYPNIWGQIILKNTEEAIGEVALSALLNAAKMPQYINKYPPEDLKKEFPFEHVGLLWQAIYQRYGSKDSYAIARSAGYRSFRAGLEKFESMAKASSSATKWVTSLETRARLGLKAFASYFQMLSDQKVTLDEDKNYWYWRITLCPLCWGWEAKEPVCYLAVTTLAAAFDWITDGLRYNIEEIECIAQGGEHCVVAINKKPIE